MADTRVLIVGSGLAGAAVATRLLERKIGPVTMLEAGPPIPMRDRRLWLDHLTTGATPYDSCRDDAGGSADAGWLHNSRIIARGGSTLHWGGWCLRLRQEDFALRSAVGQGSDWPFGYEVLEPWYCAAERFLGVAGAADSVSPPRSAPTPFAAVPFTRVDGEVIRGFESLGQSYGHMPIARNITVREGRPSCQTIGTCRYCPIGARYTADETLDRLDVHSRFEMRVNTVARALLMDQRNRVAGVEYVDRVTGEAGRIEAEVVIICAGAIETPKLLLASANRDWPKGIGNASGHVGRHLVYHPLLYARGTKPVNPRRLQQELDFPTLCSRHFDTPREQGHGKLFMFLPQTIPRVDLAALMRVGPSSAELRRIVEGPVEYELQGFMEMFSRPESRVGLRAASDRLGLPRTDLHFDPPKALGESLSRNLERLGAVLSAAGFTGIRTGIYRPRGDHAAATCRASLTSTDGVTGPDLRVHGVDNLYVCSNAVFPSVGAVNPTLTLAALALRLGTELAVA